MTDANELHPFQPFRARQAGLPVDTALREDVSPSLAVALHEWIVRVVPLDSAVPQRVALRLNLPPQPNGWLPTIGAVDNNQLLEVIDAMLQLSTALDNLDVMAGGHTVRDRYVLRLRLLDEALEDAGSAYKVAANYQQLVSRVDPTVEAAAAQAITSADPTAADLLRQAWNLAYGLNPDPTTAYSRAVKAVEEVACPLVLPANPKPTLGTVLAHLHQASAQWHFMLVDKAGHGTVEPLVAMIDRLWTGQVSRHGGGKNSRDSTQTEAEAAVHLAAVLVHLLATGALTRKSTP